MQIFSDDSHAIVNQSIDPLPPSVVKNTANTIEISWPAAKYCGISSPDFNDTIFYSIEIAEGIVWKEGFISKFINDVSATEYKQVLYNSNVYSATITDLEAARWYHIKLSISYGGRVAVSDSLSVHTARDVPSPPGRPRAYLLPVANMFNFSDSSPKYKLSLTWTGSSSNGSLITKYKLQLMALDSFGYPVVDTDEKTLVKRMKVKIRNSDDMILGGAVSAVNKQSNQWTRSSGKSLVQIKNSLKNRPNSPLKFSLADSKAGNIGNSPWVTIYCNLNRSVTMSGPSNGELEWRFRVKALNNLGWSNWSELLVMNAMSFPLLFNVHDYIPLPVTVPETVQVEQAEDLEMKGEQKEHEIETEQNYSEAKTAKEASSLTNKTVDSNAVNVNSSVYPKKKSTAPNKDKSSPTKSKQAKSESELVSNPFFSDELSLNSRKLDTGHSLALLPEADLGGTHESSFYGFSKGGRK